MWQILRVTTADRLYVFSSKRVVKWNLFGGPGQTESKQTACPRQEMAATAGTCSGMMAFRHESMMLVFSLMDWPIIRVIFLSSVYNLDL